MPDNTGTTPMHAAQQHQHVSELLPFYANGTLHDTERAEVEAHLRGCLNCRAELAAEQRLLRAFRATDSDERQVDDGFDRVMSRVRGGSTRPSARWQRWGRRTLHHVARRAAMVAVLAGVVVGIAQMQDNAGLVKQTFHTLSQDGGQVVGADVVYVAFDAKASMGAINDALAAVRGDVVSGPNRDNVFTVRVPAAQVAAAVDVLKARAEVRFVAAAAPGATP